MPFSDSRFLLFFLPAVLGLYFLASAIAGRHRSGRSRPFGLANTLIAVASLVFLASGNRSYAAILATATVALGLIGRTIDRASGPDRSEPGAVPELGFALGLTAILALFAALTWPNPLVPTFDAWSVAFTEHRFTALGLVVPLGLAVFVCHGVSFLVDIYRRHATVAPNPVHAAAYLLAFPFLVAGPVVRYRDVERHLATRQIGMASFAYGVRRFTLGLAKVALIGQTLGLPAAVALSAAGNGALGFAAAWMGLVCMTLQVYFDLSGYADMALGIGRMLGFRLPENFNAPYAADSLRDFWRRWHISLTTWCTSYLPWHGMPVVLAAMALWYGATAGVVAWCALHLLVVSIEQRRLGRILARWPAPARHAYVLVVVSAGWVLFRAEDAPMALGYFQALIGLGAVGVEAVGLPLTGLVWTALVAGLLAAVPVLPTVSRWSVTVDALATALQMIVTTAAMFVWVRVLRQGSDDDHP